MSALTDAPTAPSVDVRDMPATLRVFRVDDWLDPTEVSAPLAQAVGVARSREIVAMGRWSGARRAWVANAETG